LEYIEQPGIYTIESLWFCNDQYTFHSEIRTIWVQWFRSYDCEI